MEENTALSGMTAIRDFCKSISLASSEVTVIQYIQQFGFPARKLGGVWESDKNKIIEWRKKYVSGELPDEENKNGKPAAKQDKKKK